MKTRNLSLAILVALGVAACGSSNDGGSKKPNKPEQPEQPVKPDPKPEVEDTVVDPTKADVVKAFKLDQKSSVGSVSYIRGEQSQFNINEDNKDVNSATSVFLGLDLDSQNPHLTNIVLGKLKDKKVAQFAGSRSQSFADENAKSLQFENAKNVGSIATAVGANKYSYLNGLFNKVTDPTTAPTKADGSEPQEIGNTLSAYLHLVNEVNVKKAALDKAIADKADVSAAATAYNSALHGLYNEAKAKKIGFELAAKKAGVVLSGKAINLSYVDEEGKARPAKTDGTEAAVAVSVTPDLASWMDYARTLGHDVVPFSTAHAAGEALTPANPLDLGLVTIDYSKTDGKAEVHGVENQEGQTQTTRIFGHYYLAPKAGKQIDGSNLEIDVNEDSEILNSYSGPIVYKATPAAGGDKENTLGAIAQPLNHVQYGRVTAQVDPDSGQDVGVNGNWKLKRVNFASKMGKSSADSVDYYFARGTGETSLAEMSNLPKESLIVYRGHAISWGVNNEYNFGKDIPNAFGTSTKRGIGNFVYAELDTGKNSFAGNIYNSWVDVNEQGKITSTKADKRRLIDFTGDVVGNSVVGTAKLAYDASKTGELRATFYGKNAEEVGGSVNSTTYKEVYKDAEWGAVFGAKRVETPEEVIIKKDSNQWLGDTEQ